MTGAALLLACASCNSKLDGEITEWRSARVAISSATPNGGRNAIESGEPEQDESSHYVPWLIGAYTVEFAALALIWFESGYAFLSLAPLTLVPAPVVHFAHGESGRAVVAFLGSGVMVFGGAILFRALDPDIGSHDCPSEESSDGVCDWDPLVGALAFGAVWATMDVTNVIWNPRPTERSARRPGFRGPVVASFGQGVWLGAGWSF